MKQRRAAWAAVALGLALQGLGQAAGAATTTPAKKKPASKSASTKSVAHAKPGTQEQDSYARRH